MRCAVVGHVEWVEFARVPRMPAAGEIVHADASGRSRPAAAPSWRASWRCSPAAASSSRRSVSDELGRGRPHAGSPSSASTCTSKWGGATRRAWTHVDADGERTITVLGDKLLPAARCRSTATTSSSSSRASRGAPRRRDARASSPATARELPTLRDGDVQLDLLVASANDPGERYDGSLDVRHVAVTDGANGGTPTASPYAAAPADADRRHLRRRRLVRRRARVRAGPRRRSHEMRRRWPRGPARR